MIFQVLHILHIPEKDGLAGAIGLVQVQLRVGTFDFDHSQRREDLCAFLVLGTKLSGVIISALAKSLTIFQVLRIVIIRNGLG